MKLHFLQSLIYGFASGIAEFLPISSTAHETVLLRMFGYTEHNPLLDLCIHAALLVALILGAQPFLSRIRRDNALAARVRSRHRAAKEIRGVYETRLLRTAGMPMVVILLLLLVTRRLSSNLPVTALFLVLSGVVLYITDHLPKSNKDAKDMSGLGSILIGLSASACVFPGVSRIGMSASVATMLGADGCRAYSWSLLLSIPALVVLMIIDLVSVITIGVGTVSLPVLAGYLAAMLAAVAGGYAGIRFMRKLTAHSGLSGFAYYVWGLALFSFILYLLV